MENFYIVARIKFVPGPVVVVENQLFPINSWFAPLFFAEHPQPPNLQPIKKG
jgi:hypothetical protein